MLTWGCGTQLAKGIAMRVKPSPNRRVWMLVPQVVAVIVGLATLAAIVSEWIGVIEGVLLFGAALVASMVLSFSMMRSYRCPDCERILRAPRGWWYRLPGDPILFRCARCETDWDFGLRGHED